MTTRHTIVGLLCLLLLGLAFLFGRPPVVTHTLSGDEAAWLERIQEVGAVSGYEELGVSVKGEAPSIQHAAAHAFGGALFAAEGVKGLSVCDSNFNFGCFHEFLGRAIASLGLQSVPSLNEACFEVLTTTGLSCQHGIGHGLQAYFGYSRKALDQALLQCKDLPYSDPIGGCYGGVFMEYNLQTMLGTEARLRKLGDNPFDPCDSLDEEYKLACVYWQPQLWDQTLIWQGSTNEVANFAQMGGWCETYQTDSLLRGCFEGLGNIASPAADFEAEQAARLCVSASSNATYQLYCRSVAANSLGSGGAGKVGDGAAVCKGLVGEPLQYCMKYAKNISNVVEPGVVPRGE